VKSHRIAIIEDSHQTKALVDALNEEWPGDKGANAHVLGQEVRVNSTHAVSAAHFAAGWHAGLSYGVRP
jgi:hypothetical protein